ncbi:MAG TPA: hypothetical protein VI796_02735 [Candidatus Thermoplasmatota archaeon]|nr:hypothetical protein [Candidatus Thermoplasmatota archaeon]
MTSKTITGLVVVAVMLVLVGIPAGRSPFIPPFVYETAGVQYSLADSGDTDDFSWECMNTVCVNDLDDVDRDTDVCHDDPALEDSAFTMKSGATRKLVLHPDFAQSEGISCDSSLTVEGDGRVWDLFEFSECQADGETLTGCAIFDVDSGYAYGIYACVPGQVEDEDQLLECRDYRMSGMAWNKVAGVGAAVHAWAYIPGWHPMHDVCGFDGILLNHCYVEEAHSGVPTQKSEGFRCMPGMLEAAFTVGGTVVIDRVDHCY